MSTGWYGERIRWSKASALREFGESNNIANSKIVANNTLHILTMDGRRVLRLHKTNVLTRMPDGTVILNSGRWLTKTTKDRINEFLPKFLAEDAPRVYVGSDRGVWKLSKFEYISQAGEPREDAAPTHTFLSLFYDGIVLRTDGTPVEPKPDLDGETRKVRRLLTKFVKMVRTWEGNLPQPGLGDCIPCRVEAEHPGKWSKDHLLSHLEDPYLHGTLIYNALTAKGYSHQQMSFIWNHKDIVARALRAYFKKNLELALA